MIILTALTHLLLHEAHQRLSNCSTGAGYKYNALMWGGNGLNSEDFLCVGSRTQCPFFNIWTWQVMTSAFKRTGEEKVLTLLNCLASKKQAKKKRSLEMAL